ncbi:hypothetical protein T439DRAFT_318529 [Meredithblackwellia eburnea MCA 4105]
MPRSKRNTTVHLTKVDKKGKEVKGKVIEDVRLAADEFDYLWLFKTEHVRNNFLKEVRGAWVGSKIFMARNAVMRKALGATPEEECRLGVSKIANKLEGEGIGLLFTSESPEVVEDWFESYKKPDFARTGNKVEEGFVLPSGPILINEEPALHSLDPQFRKLGLVTSMVKGVPTLNAEHTVCKEGDTLNQNQVQLLKLFGRRLAVFQIIPTLGIKLADGSAVGGVDMEE